jgi:DNA gyrase inhibitor GyrI
MSEETGQTSNEERFLGVRTTITPPEEAAEGAETTQPDEIEVEVVDDRSEEDQRLSSGEKTGAESDPELQQYGEKVQKRIKKLKYDFHEERRAKEASERLSSEAVEFTKTLQTENQQLLKLVQDSQSALSERSQYGADAAVAIATENFKKAHESGDADQIAGAQQALTQAQMYQASASAVPQQIIDNWKQQALAEQRQQDATQPQAEPQPQEPDPRAVEWEQDNPWFGSDREMTSFAFGVHERLVRDEGVDPSSAEYYELIDERMKAVFPTHFGNSNVAESGESVVVETAPRRKASTVVAPATRNNGAMPRKIQLTQTQVSLAKRLGLTPQQYAQQLLKEMS